MSSTLAQAFQKNFLGNSPDWYRNTIVIFLIANPILLMLTNPFVVGWVLIAQFIFTLAMALKCYPLQPGGLLALEAIILGLASPEHVYDETVANFQVILLLMFMVAGIYFMRDILFYTCTKILLGVRSKTTLSLLFCFAGAVLSSFLDALTVTAVLITVSVGFYSVYHKVASGKDMTDDQIMALNRGGHDPYKVYAAYSEAVASKGKPTVILAHTVKGYGLGDGQAANDTHSVKKLDSEQLRYFRDRFGIPVADEELETVPYYRPAEDSPEITYMKRRREALAGPLPSRKHHFEPMQVPALNSFKKQLESTGEREISTTMAFVRVLSTLVKDKNIGQYVVPIVPDEARTFGMEGMFRQLGIYTSAGQKYVPHDHQQIMYYKEDKKGVILEEGINEAGAMSAWLALATSYSTNAVPMIPFYIFYSMFGFQRIGDLAWASGDSQARGFLIGATAGRTTLNGEGLQHQDGHSLILANTCLLYTSDAADEEGSVDLGGRRIIKKKKKRAANTT